MAAPSTIDQINPASIQIPDKIYKIYIVTTPHSQHIRQHAANVTMIALIIKINCPAPRPLCPKIKFPTPPTPTKGKPTFNPPAGLFPCLT